MTTVTALLTNKAYGFPARGARRRVKAPILAAFGAGVVRVKEGQSGRGERSGADTIQLSIRIETGSVTNVPTYVHRSSEIA